MLKAGDKVICIKGWDNLICNTGHKLIEGNIYTIKYTYFSSRVVLQEITYPINPNLEIKWHIDSFRKIMDDYEFETIESRLP